MVRCANVLTRTVSYSLCGKSLLFLNCGQIGNEIYSKISGYDTLAADASPLREDAVLKAASATKLITSIALLQCVDQGLIGLDEPLTKILPELDGKEILKGQSDTGFVTEPSKNKITARHLLSHTSGLGYHFLHPLLIAWAETPAGQTHAGSQITSEKYNTPLIFEPGTGWQYGSSSDWAGVVVRRLHHGVSLEDYFNEHIWQPVGISAPFPTFNLSKHPEYSARLMQSTLRTPDGLLQDWEFLYGNNTQDQEGGVGLSTTAKDYLAVLADLVSDNPKLLKPETISMMFTPQLEAGSAAVPMLLELRPAWEVVSGPVSDKNVNHGLGGLLLLGDVPEIGQPKNLLAWGGATNLVWFACKDSGVAGFFATQVTPMGDPQVKELINAWKKDFWAGLNSRP